MAASTRSILVRMVRSATRKALDNSRGGWSAGPPDEPATAGLDLIEAQFYGYWSNEADWFDLGGPEGTASLDELEFFKTT